MARPTKQTVDYFPHDTDASEGKTLTIIQAKYGNDGFAFWFKLLQLLGKSPGHYFDFNNPADWEFLLAKTHQKDTETVIQILETLVLLGAIDKELYEHGIIWCQKFVNGVADAYSRTVEGVPHRPDFLVKESLRQIAGRVGFSESYLSQVITGKRPPSNKLLEKCLSLGIDIMGVNVEDKGVSVPKDEVTANTNSQNATEIPQTKRILKGKDTILPEWIDKELWDAYLKGRKKPTEQAVVLLLKKLEEFRNAGDDPNEVLKRSIMNGWTGIFPLDKKGGSHGAHRQSSTKLPPRDGYTKPPPNPKLDKLVEQQRAADASSGRDEPG